MYNSWRCLLRASATAVTPRGHVLGGKRQKSQEVFADHTTHSAATEVRSEAVTNGAVELDDSVAKSAKEKNSSDVVGHDTNSYPFREDVWKTTYAAPTSVIEYVTPTLALPQ